MTTEASPPSTDIIAALHAALFAQAAMESAAAVLAHEKAKYEQAASALEVLMQTNKMQGVTSTLGSADLVTELVFAASDWPKLYEHIQTTGNFDLLHKRISLTAMRDRDSNNELPPGVRRVPLTKLKLSTR